jgi:hypothetical protein
VKRPKIIQADLYKYDADIKKIAEASGEPEWFVKDVLDCTLRTMRRILMRGEEIRIHGSLTILLKDKKKQELKKKNLVSFRGRPKYTNYEKFLRMIGDDKKELHDLTPHEIRNIAKKLKIQQHMIIQYWRRRRKEMRREEEYGGE